MAEARSRWWGDTEKVATTSLRGLSVHGVELSSRYEKAHEYDTMVAIVDALSEELRPKVESIFCDSKANCCYSVTLRRCSEEQMLEIANQLHHGCVEKDGGHNGIDLSGPGRSTHFVEPNWWCGDEE